MKKILFWLLLLSSPVLAQYELGFSSAEQYQTVSGWRLHVVLDMGENLWPPSGYERTEMLLSTMTMGVYEPFDAIATLERKIPERDPEFTLLGQMTTNKTWYGRIRIYANGTTVMQTAEFTFIFPDIIEPVQYTGTIPWVAVSDGWNTSVAFHNPNEESATVLLRAYSISGGDPVVETLVLNPHHTFAGYILQHRQFYGAVELESDYPISWMSLMNLDGENNYAGFNGETK